MFQKYTISILFLIESFRNFLYKKNTIWYRVNLVHRGRKNSGLMLTLVYKYLGGG